MAKATKAAAAATPDEQATVTTTTTQYIPPPDDDTGDDPTENEETRPKAEGVVDFVKALNVKEVNTLLALFEPPFAVSEVWAAGRAVIDMGEKIEGYISANRLPSFASHQAASTVTGEEIAQQVRAHMKAAATTADGSRPVVGANGEVALDPVLAGLLINLATRALALFLERLGAKK